MTSVAEEKQIPSSHAATIRADFSHSLSVLGATTDRGGGVAR